MARPPRRLWLTVVRNFLYSFKSKQSASQLIGEDKLGNKYFEALPTTASNRRKPSRYYQPLSGEEDFDQKLPAEWEAWLRGRRKVPPTPEEIAQNDAIAALKKQNAAELDAARLDTKLLDVKKDISGPESFPKYGKEYETIPGHRFKEKE